MRRRRRIARALHRARSLRGKLRREWVWLRRDLRDLGHELRSRHVLPEHRLQSEMSRKDVARDGRW